MKLLLRCFCMLAVFAVCHVQAQDLELMPQSTFETGIFDEGAAEIVSYDRATSRLFFTNADANTIGILDISDPTNLTLVTNIDISTYGAGVNSCAFSNGILAVAVEADPVTDAGSVVFFNADGEFQAAVTVGALPDMVAFTPDGTKLIVANEGEPNDDYTIDPQGTISIIDLAGGVAAATVSTADFTAFDDKRASLINRGIRIFGPDASVSQDLEPEYITVTPDNTTALVALQENNALAVVDIASATVVDILPLGYKDHNSGTPSLREFKLNELVDLPALGVPVLDTLVQDTVFLSGFSGMWFDENESTDSTYIFYIIPDRGPNEAAVPQSNLIIPNNEESAPGNLRPFKLPDYQARIARFEININSGEAELLDQIFLTQDKAQGVRPITGRGNVFFGFDEIPVRISRFYDDTTTMFTDADFVDTIARIGYRELPFDSYGGDFEGILRDNEGNFWMCDEYRPSLYKFDPTGLLIERYVPEGTGDLVIDDLGFSLAGQFGQETLPRVYLDRRANRGFEAIAHDTDADIIYAFIQSPIENPDRATVRNNSDVIRILGIDPTDGTPVAEYVYLLERNRDAGIGTRVDKIGDAVYIGNGKFLVLERDSSRPEETTGKKYVCEIDLTHATNILADFPELSAKTSSSGPKDKTLEMMTADDLAAAGINTAFKRKVVNLPSVGYLPSDKPEGLSLLPDGSIAVINDNDFGIAGAGYTDESSLGIISFGTDNALDASNRDDAINIANYPTLGMYQPDAITTFEVNGEVFILSANEGDARDYDGYSEEARVADLTLDPAQFPDAASLQEAAALGRLNTTLANGDLDGDGENDRIFSYGARSFSVWDAVGNLVWDSGNDFELITAEFEEGAYFNSNNDENGSFDARSDDKGPEPEAVEVGQIGPDLYAFIGLERIGGIMIYNINDPRNPRFVNYINNRDFSGDAEAGTAGDLGVEDILFITPQDSPVDMPLIVTANEVSGTVTIFSTNMVTDIDNPNVQANTLEVFPNPVKNMLFTNVVSDYQVISVTGKVVGQAQNTNRIEMSTLPAGSYFVRDIKNNQSRMFVKQ